MFTWYFSFIVDLALNQEGPPLCGGRMVNFKCSTTTNDGSLRWDINSVEVFSIDNSVSVGQNLTMNGNTFVFTEAGTVSGVNVYTSTAELNPTTTTITVLCSDGGIPESRTLNIVNGECGNAEKFKYSLLLLLQISTLPIIWGALIFWGMVLFNLNGINLTMLEFAVANIVL